MESIGQYVKLSGYISSPIKKLLLDKYSIEDKYPVNSLYMAS